MADGISITIGASLASSLITALVTYWQTTRRQARQIANDPLNCALVSKPEKFVRYAEFNRFVEQNQHDHENLFNRLAHCEREGGELRAVLDHIKATTDHLLDLCITDTKVGRTPDFYQIAPLAGPTKKG